MPLVVSTLSTGIVSPGLTSVGVAVVEGSLLILFTGGGGPILVGDNSGINVWSNATGGPSGQAHVAGASALTTQVDLYNLGFDEVSYTLLKVEGGENWIQHRSTLLYNGSWTDSLASLSGSSANVLPPAITNEGEVVFVHMTTGEVEQPLGTTAPGWQAGPPDDTPGVPTGSGFLWTTTGPMAGVDYGFSGFATPENSWLFHSLLAENLTYDTDALAFTVDPGNLGFVAACRISQWRADLTGGVTPPGGTGAANEAVDCVRNILTHQRYTVELDGTFQDIFKIFDDEEDDTVDVTTTLETLPCKTPGIVIIPGNGVMQAFYTRGTTLYYKVSEDFGDSWGVATTVATGYTMGTALWLERLAGRRYPVVMMYLTNNWYVTCGTVNDDGTITWSTPVDINVNASEVQGRLIERIDGVVEFIYKTQGGAISIVRCDELGQDGAGVWA